MRFVIILFFSWISCGSLWAQKDTITTGIYPKSKTQKSSFYKKIIGENYREVYSTPIVAQRVSLDTLYGGLYPTEIQSMNQATVLILKNKKGQYYRMQPLKKRAIDYFNNTIYQDKYTEKGIKDSQFEAFVEDMNTTTHPYASVVVPFLSEATQVYYTRPQIFYVHIQDVLADFEFGDGLYLIEEHLSTTTSQKFGWGTPLEIITTNQLIQNLDNNPNHQVDAAFYVRTRLMDIVLGDNDRTVEQWYWAKFKENNQVMYRPIPRDRSNVFSTYEGYFSDLIPEIIPIKEYNPSYLSVLPEVRKAIKNSLSLDTRLMQSITLGEVYEQAEWIKNRLTDAVINSAFEKIPKEAIDYQWVEVKRALQYRRDNLLKIAKEFHTIIAKNVIITASNKKDLITITRLQNGLTTIKIAHANQTYFEGEYKQNKTQEIWIYALDGEDIIEVKGEEEVNIIPIKIVGGTQNDWFKIENENGIELFDEKSSTNTFQKSGDVKITLTDEINTNSYDLYKRKSKTYKISPKIGSNPDDGLSIGVKNVLQYNELRQKPFTHLHQLDFSYYTFTNGYDLSYKGVHATLLDDYHTFVELQMTSPNYANNFFGYGNDQRKGAFILDYYRYKLSTYSVAVGLSKFREKGGDLAVKLLFESKKIAHIPNRLLSNNPLEFFERNNFIGLDATLNYQKIDDAIFTTKGIRLVWQNGIKTNIQASNQTYFYSIPSFTFTHYLIPSKKLVLATKVKGHLIVGNENNLQVYQMATIGGDDGLRGFNNERFTGIRSAYWTTDLRYNYKQTYVGIVPINLGFFAGFDAGRVWTQNDTSKTIHTSFGLGTFLKASELITGQAGLFFSTDGPRFVAGVGFRI